MKILITETWNPVGYAKRSHVRLHVRSRDLSPSLSACVVSFRFHYSGIARLRAASTRNVFRDDTRRQASATSEELVPIWLPSVLFLPSRGVNAREISVLLPYGNTLDRTESRLSARLPRIMDATVTHVNEACHLHLLLRLPLSPRLPSPRISYPLLG